MNFIWLSTGVKGYVHWMIAPLHLGWGNNARKPKAVYRTRVKMNPAVGVGIK